MRALQTFTSSFSNNKGGFNRLIPALTLLAQRDALSRLYVPEAYGGLEARQHRGAEHR
jgi:hypothetical protein